MGAAVARELAEHGHSVSLIYRNSAGAAEEAAAEVRKLGGEAVTIRADLSDPLQAQAAVDATLDAMGRIDVLAHCAGAYSDWKPVRDLTAEDWSRYIESDLNGFVYILSATLRHMHDRKSGAIVAISSIAAQACQSRGGQAAASKAALDALIRVVAREEGRHGIRANGVAIGLTATGMGSDAEKQWGAEATKRLIAGTPLQRMGQPEEIARVFRFLASDEASYVTGKILQVDGGQIIAG